MAELNRRAVERQRRILGRAVRRGEQPAGAIADFEAQHPEVFSTAPPEKPPTPFTLPNGEPLDLRNLWAGQAVFLLCGGPSIRSLDLSRLLRRGIMTFGINNSPTLFRTHFQMFVDQPKKFHDGIWLDGGCLKFCPTRMMGRHIRRKLPSGTFEVIRRLDATGTMSDVTPRDCPGVVGYERNASLNYDTFLSEPTVNWGHSKKSWQRNKAVPRILNSMLAVLKICYLLGFRIVYLLGADFQMDPACPYGFGQAKDAGQCASNNGGYQSLATILGELRPRFEAAGFRVFNCNPASRLAVFPHVPFGQAVGLASDHVPQDPLDAAGWYELN